MKFLSFAILILIFYLTQGCSKHQNVLQSNSAIYKYYKNEYINSLKKFNNRYTSHFPVDFESTFITILVNLSESAKEFDVNKLILLKKASKLEIDSIKSVYCNKTLGNYSSNDTCLFIIRQFIDTSRAGIEYSLSSTFLDHYFSKKCMDGKLPIPNFWDIKVNFSNTQCNLPSSFIISVIDAQPGKYLDKKYLIESNYLHNKWEHGFSRGIAYSYEKALVIYWLILW